MFSCPQREGTPASQGSQADRSEGSLARELATDRAMAGHPSEAAVDELVAQSAAAADRLRATEDWHYAAWVSELRRLVDSLNRARTGEERWADSEGQLDRAWAVVARYASKGGGDPRRIHGRCWSLPNTLGRSLYRIGLTTLRPDHRGKLSN